MYNLMISGNSEAWELPSYEFDIGRYLEYTVDSIRDVYMPISAKILEELKAFPTLFMYEQFKGIARVGYLRNIKDRGGAIAIEYEFDNCINPIPGEKIKDLSNALNLNLRNGEQYRTHWSIKNVDLLSVLHEHGLADGNLVNSSGTLGRLEEMRFRVAFSFPGELRDYVKVVSDHVKAKLPPGSVFYDDDFMSQLARPNLDNLLQKLYLSNSDLVVVFLSSDYEKKRWCGIEWRAVRGIINNRIDDAVMFVRADDAEVPGVFAHDGYIDMKRFPPEQVATFVLDRIRLQRRLP